LIVFLQPFINRTLYDFRFAATLQRLAGVLMQVFRVCVAATLAVLSFVLVSCGADSPDGVRVAAGLAPLAPQNVDVVTHHNDVARTGQNLHEHILNPQNVSPVNFGLRRKLFVTGRVDGQPLYLSQLTIKGEVHDVLFVATEHDLVYAYDVVSGAQLWQVSLLGAGEAPTGQVAGCPDVAPEIGVTATPVIDRSAGPNGTLYVVAMSIDANNNYFQRLHALDVATGAEMNGSPAEIQASYTLNGQSSTFSPVSYKERAALLLLNGVIYTTWASHCDDLPYGGWVIAYDQHTLQQVSALNLGPSNLGPSIWQSGGGPAADSQGDVYLATANGAFDTNMDSAGFPTSRDFGNSFVRLTMLGKVLSVRDYWTMTNTVGESAADLDLGSSGPMVLPDQTDATGHTRQLLIGGGKDGNLWLLDRENLGKFNASFLTLYEPVGGATPGQVFSSPAYFNGTIYYGDVHQNGLYGSLKAFPISNGMISNTPTHQTTTLFPYPGASPSISANGATNAIVWAAESEQNSAAVLHAYLADDLGTELYNSQMVTTGRDAFGTGNKFGVPVIADGMVFVAVQDGVGVFGLLP
jgi:hypothetical protein